jgi:hypothetical protein
MKKPMIRIHNSQTNEIIDRQMNDNEFTQYEKDIADELKNKVKAEARVLAKSDLLAKLGISAEEAALLLS